MIHANKQCRSFDIQQHTDCVDMLQSCLHRPLPCCARCKTSKHRLTHSQEGKTTHEHIAQDTVRRTKTVGKTIVVTTLAVPTYP